MRSRHLALADQYGVEWRLSDLTEESRGSQVLGHVVRALPGRLSALRKASREVRRRVTRWSSSPSPPWDPHARACTTFSRKTPTNFRYCLTTDRARNRLRNRCPSDDALHGSGRRDPVQTRRVRRRWVRAADIHAPRTRLEKTRCRSHFVMTGVARWRGQPLGPKPPPTPPSSAATTAPPAPDPAPAPHDTAGTAPHSSPRLPPGSSVPRRAPASRR